MTYLLIFNSFVLIGGLPTAAVGNFSPPAPATYRNQFGHAAAAEGIRARGVLLAYLDRDGDRRLAPAELPERLLRVFPKADLNGDGFLDGAEIALGKTKISQQARKVEHLRLDRRGELVERNGGGAGLGGARLLGRFERESPDTTPSAPASTATALVGPPAAPPPPSASSSSEPSNLAAPATPQLTHQSPAARAAEQGRAGEGKGGLPTAEQILANLDRNGDGVVDTGEAVDQLADNFARLDKDKSGGLDFAEIDRGLKLARLFGIKPKVDPRSYQRSAHGAPHAN